MTSLPVIVRSSHFRSTLRSGFIFYSGNKLARVLRFEFLDVDSCRATISLITAGNIYFFRAKALVMPCTGTTPVSACTQVLTPTTRTSQSCIATELRVTSRSTTLMTSAFPINSWLTTSAQQSCGCFQAEKAALEAESVNCNSRHTHFIKYKIALKKNNADQGACPRTIFNIHFWCYMYMYM